MGGSWLLNVLIVLFVQISLHATFGIHVQGVVTTDCEYSYEEALITYVGDPEGVVAVNQAGDECIFQEDTATATYTLLVKFFREFTTDCVFDKTDNMELYSITVQGRLTVADFENAGDEVFQVQCSFEIYADDITGDTDVEDAVSAPVIVTQNTGVLANSNFSVYPVKIDETRFNTPLIRHGRLIKLRAEMTGTVNETKFLVTNCRALSSDKNASAALISDGCGTGFPFLKTEGFTLRGLTAISPSFRMFRIKRYQGVLFYCSFVICNNDCGDNSCGSSKRKRRDTSHLETREVEFHIQDADESDDETTNEIVLGGGKVDRQRRSLIDPLYNILNSTVLSTVQDLLGETEKGNIENIKTIPRGFIASLDNGEFMDDEDEDVSLLNKNDDVVVQTGVYQVEQMTSRKPDDTQINGGNLNTGAIFGASVSSNDISNSKEDKQTVETRKPTLQTTKSNHYKYKDSPLDIGSAKSNNYKYKDSPIANIGSAKSNNYEYKDSPIANIGSAKSTNYKYQDGSQAKLDLFKSNSYRTSEDAQNALSSAQSKNYKYQNSPPNGLGLVQSKHYQYKDRPLNELDSVQANKYRTQERPLTESNLVQSDFYGIHSDKERQSQIPPLSNDNGNSQRIRTQLNAKVEQNIVNNDQTRQENSAIQNGDQIKPHQEQKSIELNDLSKHGVGIESSSVQQRAELNHGSKENSISMSSRLSEVRDFSTNDDMNRGLPSTCSLMTINFSLFFFSLLIHKIMFS